MVMTLFGRDSIFTSLQAASFTPELAATTIRVLGMWQATRVDDFRDEDPGWILHEMRDFWVEDGEYVALPLDSGGNQVDPLTSNNGHVLWSGIVEKSKARARHLIEQRLYSG